MSEQDTKKLEGLVKLLKTEVNAKKVILEEVLRTVDKDQEKSSSVKKRVYIREIYLSFVNNFISINIFVGAKDCSARWILFENQSSIIVSPVVGSHQSAVLCVSVPFSAFFDDEKISLSIHGKIIQAQSQIFNPSFRLHIECNQTSVAPPEACISELISIAEATEDLDLKAIEYMDEKSAIRIVQSLFVVYSHLEIQSSLKFSIFRRNFPTFVENDFETWRLYAGCDRFEGILVYTQIDGDDMKSRVIAKSIACCQKFLKIINEKCFKD